MSRLNAIILILFLVLISCQHNSRPKAEALFNFIPEEFPKYNLSNPNAKYFLPYVLEEISGMSYYANGVIACVQDEEGKVFLYNQQQRKIERTIRFAGSGDYEGIATSGNLVYVAKSNGTIYKFNVSEANKPHKLKVYETILKKHNDIEGLAFDHNINKLIIACKGDAGVGKKEIKGTGYFYFNLDKKEVKKKPAFTITKTKIKKYLEEHKEFAFEANRINFKPSGIALHPINDHYYIIASVGKLLLITNRNGDIKGSIPLDPRLLGQPEGICFAPNGDMFISSEGQGDKGYILKFNMK